MTTMTHDAIPASDKPVARFWNRIARKYAARQISDIPAYEKTLERTRAWLNADDTVLELGGGTGSTAILHAPHVRHITGSDISDEMTALARAKLGAADAPTNVDFVTATADDPRFQPESFDAVLAFNFLHLVGDLSGTLARARTLLKPGGLIIAKTPCIGDMGFVPRLVVPVVRMFYRAPEINFLSKAELLEAFEAAGFRIEESGIHAKKGHILFVVGRRGDD
ncbi:MAG: class I SAM-dependent methyltransferase [Alphaproteobacteria bacterium]